MRPEYYRENGAIETWDYIVSQGLGFLEGNVVKYVTRAGRKNNDTRMEDLQKARTYIEKLIEVEQTRLDSKYEKQVEDLYDQNSYKVRFGQFTESIEELENELSRILLGLSK